MGVGRPRKRQREVAGRTHTLQGEGRENPISRKRQRWAGDIKVRSNS